MISITTCRVCGGNQFTTLFTCKDYTVSQKLFSLIQCNRCSVIITSPRPEDETLGEYYQSEDYISHTSKANNLINLLYLNVRKITLKQKHEMLESITNQKTILDYGCGTGSLISYLQTKGWQVKGYEPDANARKIAQTTCKVYDKPQSINESFDVITLWHVLEHTTEPNETLSLLSKLLKPKGKLVIAVPNHKSYDADFYKQYWAAYDVPRHLWHFNREAMERLLQFHGFVIQKIEPMKFDAYYVSLLSESNKNNSFLKFLKGFIRGFRSNLKAQKTGEYSSLIYIASR